MSGLLLKDLLLHRRLGVYAALLLCAGVALAAALGEAAGTESLLYALAFLLSLLPAGSLRQDCLARWEKYAAATPAGRRGVVGSKYLLALCTALLPFPAALLARPLGLLPWLSPASPALLLRTALVCAEYLLLANALVLPPALCTRAPDGGGSIYLLLPAFFFVSWAAGLPGGVLGWLALPAAALFLLSWRLALGLYRRKEL